MPEDDFYFVQVTDTHLGTRQSFQHAQQIVKLIDRLPVQIECVVHTGDIMDGNIHDAEKVADALALFRQIKVPLHFIPGNHDILPGRIDEGERIFRSSFGELMQRAEYHGVVFLFLHTDALTEVAPQRARQILATVETQLRSADGKPVIAFQHAPSMRNVDYRTHEFIAGCATEVLTEWNALLGKYDVKAVVAGHANLDQHHWVGDVPVYVAPPAIGGRGRAPSCRLFHYSNGKMAYWTLHLDPPKSLRARLRDKLRKYAVRLTR